MRMAGLRDRTKKYALRIIRVFSSLPRGDIPRTIGRQMLRSGTSVAANFREASRARSDAEFIAKLGIVEQELDETLLWLELLVESDQIQVDKLQPLMNESDELLRIIVTAVRKTKDAKR